MKIEDVLVQRNQKIEQDKQSILQEITKLN